MSIDELNEEQMMELKQAILCSRGDVSYGELAGADTLVSDEEVEELYGGTEFSEEDFCA